MNKDLVRNILRRYRDAYAALVQAERMYNGSRKEAARFNVKEPPLTRMNKNEIRKHLARNCKVFKENVKVAQKEFSKCERELYQFIR